MRVTEAGWTPRWYSQYRFYLSILVGSCIISTLLGINYFGPTTQATLDHHLHDLGGAGSASALMDRNVLEKRNYSARAFPLSDSIGFKVEDGVATNADTYVVIKKLEQEEQQGEEGGELPEGKDET